MIPSSVKHGWEIPQLNGRTRRSSNWGMFQQAMSDYQMGTPCWRVVWWVVVCCHKPGYIYIYWPASGKGKRHLYSYMAMNRGEWLVTVRGLRGSWSAILGGSQFCSFGGWTWHSRNRNIDSTDKKWNSRTQTWITKRRTHHQCLVKSLLRRATFVRLWWQYQVYGILT